MKKLIAYVLVSMPWSSVVACDLSLLGTWKSDGPMTMAFLRENAKLDLKAMEFLEALMGHMTFTFSDSELHQVMPDIEVPVDGQLRPFAGSDDRKPYRLLFCGESTIVWSAKRSFGTADGATTFNSVGPDMVWVYTGSTEPGVPDLHAREYFQRVR
jgi:hypothetical protein